MADFRLCNTLSENGKVSRGICTVKDGWLRHCGKSPSALLGRVCLRRIPENAFCLTDREKELLPVSALILTYECGIRFLADHLNGDTYFKIHREGHNLDRARNQFKLVSDIEKKLDEMKEITKRYL